MSEAIEGGCLCGAARYTIDEEAPPAYACCCTDCQMRSGASHALILPVWRSRFSVTGDLARGERLLSAGTSARAFSCAKCLTELYSETDHLPDLYAVRAGTLDDSAALVPAAYLWVQSKQPWISFPEGARVFDQQPTDPVTWMDILELGRRPQ